MTSDWAKLSVLKLSVVKTTDIDIIADINQIVMIYLVYMCKHVKELIPQIDCELTEMSERTAFHWTNLGSYRNRQLLTVKCHQGMRQRTLPRRETVSPEKRTFKTDEDSTHFILF